MKRKDDRRTNGILSLGVLSIMIWILMSTSCSTSSDCADCGDGLIDGYLYKTVSTQDIASIPGLELESCIRFKYQVLSDEEIDSETVDVVDDCCCNEYEIE